MNGTQLVEVLGVERLRSELAMFVWAQSEIQKDMRQASGGEARDETDFHSSKANLYAGVLKLAGARMKIEELIEKLAALIAEGPNADIQGLDAKIMAGRISTRAK